MSEWRSPWNSFNSNKCISHVSYWKDIPNGKIPGPILVSIDPMNACNLRCSFCNAKEALHSDKMSKETIDKVVSALKQWGTRCTCLGGGGSPLLNENTHYLIDELHKAGIKIGIVTNGLLLDRFIEDSEKCEWIGISVDAATPETYAKMKGVDGKYFKQVLDNIEALAAHGKTEVGYKYLIHPDNYHEIFHASEIAKIIGCDLIHIRPGGNPWFSDIGYEFTDKMIDAALTQINDARADVETEDFRVYGITHKFDKNWASTKRFKRCWGGFVSCFIAPSGKIGSCCLTENTLINTNIGYKKIKDIKINDTVLTHTGNFKRVIKTFKRATNETYILKPVGYYKPMELTGNHPVYAAKREYCVVVGKSCPVFKKWKHCEHCDSNVNMDFVDAQSLKVGDFLSIPIDKRINRDIIDANLFDFFGIVNKPSHKKINKDVKFSKELCWLLGLFIAEGSYRKDANSNICGLNYSLHSNEREYREKVTRSMKNIFNVSVALNTSKTSKGIQLRIDSTPLSELFFKLCGEYSDQKQMHSVLMSLPLELQKEILNGWTDGDGFYRKMDDTYHVTSVSEILINQFYMICLRLRYYATVYDWKKMKEGKKQAYTLFYHDKPLTRQCSHFYKDLFIVPIERISINNKKQDVFNFEVENDHSYTANNIGVHNCDLRGNKNIEIGTVDDPSCWGSQKHIDIVNAIDIHKCPRCTLGFLNEVFENVILEDKMGCDFI